MSTPTRPLRADAERNRRRILAAAREVFARKGLEAGLDEIARHAGVGAGTVYRRFPDKNALVTALFEERLREFITAAETATAQPDAWSGLVGMLETTVAMQIEDRGLKDVLFAHGDHRHFAGQKAALRLLVTGVLERAQAAGTLRPDVALTDVLAVQLMVTSMAALTEDASPRLWRRYLHLLLDGLCTGRERPSPLVPGPIDAEAFAAACKAHL
jgi:AcrR family transcriptional regulator